jgi:hypothetical protein
MRGLAGVARTAVRVADLNLLSLLLPIVQSRSRSGLWPFH